MSNFMVNGVDVPSPSSVVHERERIEKAYRDAFGIFRHRPVRIIRKVNWVYKAITKEELQVLYDNVLNPLDTGVLDFDVTTEFGGDGVITSRFYLGTPLQLKSVHGVNGEITLWDLELHWIEPEGRALGNILDLPS